MRTILLYTLFVLLNISLVNGQTRAEAEKVLHSVHSVNQIDSLQASHPNWNIAIRKTPEFGLKYDSLLFHSKIGESVDKQFSEKSPIFIHKTLQKEPIELCKVQYIYLDGSNRSMSQINTLRNKIIAEYNAGVPFTDLAKRYGEDGNENRLFRLVL